MSKTYFDEENLTIEVWTGDDFYQVDLERCTGSAEMLEFVFQVAGREWCTSETLRDFIGCIEQACQAVFRRNAQTVFCSFGDDQQVDWREAKSKVPYRIDLSGDVV